MVMTQDAQQPAPFNWKNFFEVEVDADKAVKELALLETQLREADNTSTPFQGQYALEYLKAAARGLRVRVRIQGQAIWNEINGVHVITTEIQGTINTILGRLSHLDQTVAGLTGRLGRVEEKVEGMQRQIDLVLRQNEMMNRQNAMMFSQMEAITRQMGAMTQQMNAMARDLYGINRFLGLPTNEVGNGAQQGMPGQHGGMAQQVAVVFPTFAAYGLSSMAEFNARYPATAQ